MYDWPDEQATPGQVAVRETEYCNTVYLDLSKIGLIVLLEYLVMALGVHCIRVFWLSKIIML